MHKLTTVEARERFADMLNQASYQRERTIITKHGKDVAALVSVEDLRILDVVERVLDIQAARKALAEKGKRVSLADLKKELGIS
ncbi:MAG: type II toxin-antitoxin system Phd/YefM family antitoxin [Pseudomonadota bacterium]|nr:type II toxin-antitoxin system Phd/YefM family antitoxin [Pseudomonadota bacterium]